MFILSMGIFYESFGQTHSDKILQSNMDTEFMEVGIDKLSWIAGDWTGSAFGGTIEEIWSKPLGGSMMGMFRLVSDNTVSFYELCTITQEGDEVWLRIKHFNRDMSGWEEKSESKEFRLIMLKGQTAYFDGFTFERVDNKLTLYVVEEKEPLKISKFSYQER